MITAGALGSVLRVSPRFLFIRTLLRLCLFPLWVLSLDLVIRFDFLRTLDAVRWIHFLSSFFFEWFTLCLGVQLLSIFDRRRTVAVFMAAFVLSLTQVLVYGHYLYFGVLPNPYTVNYLLDHAADSWSLMLGNISWKHLLAIGLLFTGQYFLLSFTVRSFATLRPSYRRWVPVLFLVTGIVFNNNVRFAPESYSISPATIFSVKYALQERWFGTRFEMRHGYMRRRFTIAEKTKQRARWNCILFISESVRRQNLSAYGYQRTTTPFLDSLVRMGEVTLFRHHVSNAVSTQFSVPMILSGEFTIERKDRPFIYDYIQRWNGIRTNFFTSQSLQRSTIDLVYNTSLDTFVCQERLPYEPFNDLGVDDAAFGAEVRRHHERYCRSRFFSVIQFNNTHFPYTEKQQTKHFLSTKDSSVIDRYDNVIREQDALMRDYWSAFSRAGLLDSTVIIFTSDHGEAFGERGHMGHLNTLYGEEIGVPLWIHVPKGFPAKMKEALLYNAEMPTSHLDLFPTMMELFGHEVPLDSSTVWKGNSLLHPLPTDRVIPVVGKDMTDTKGVIAGTMKVLETTRDGRTISEAYRTETDWKEAQNLWTSLTPGEQKRWQEMFRTIDRTVGKDH